MRDAFDSDLEDLINILTKMKSENKLTGRISIKLHQYDYMPNVHGIMLNKKEIFISSCNWDSDRHLKAGQNIYEHYQNDISKTHEKKVTLFRRWFDYGRYRSITPKNEMLKFDSELDL